MSGLGFFHIKQETQLQVPNQKKSLSILPLSIFSILLRTQVERGNRITEQQIAF